MADIAELGLAVDARQVATADAALDKFVEAAVRAEQATKKLADAADREFSKTARAAKDSSDAHVNAYRNQQAASDRYLASLRNEINMYGKSRAEIEAVRSAQAGLTLEQQKSAVAMGAQIDAMKGQQSAMGGLMGGAQALGAIYATTFAVERIFTFTKALFDASVQGQRLVTTLDFATGGNGAKELAYVTEFANRLGLQLDSTAKAYSGMAAAARGTSLEGEGARKVFESVAKASTVMGLSAEQNTGALLSLQQMISKGTVQSEELRGQLGERLPGAFQIAARAMGVTTAELGKMLEQGLVPASEFLPKFAAQLEKELGASADAAANRLDAAVNRFETAWERLKRAGGDAGVAKAFAATADAAAGGVNSLSDSIERMTSAKSWGEWFNAAIWSQKNLTAEIKDAQAEVDRTSNLLGKAPSNIYFKTAAADAQEYLTKLQQIQAQQAGLMPGATGPGRVDRERQSARDQSVEDAKAKERADELKSYLERNAALSKTELIEKEIEAARKRSAAMASKNAGDLVAGAQINKALEQEIANIRDKHKTRGASGAAAAARDEVNAELEQFKRGQQVQEEIARRSIANINAMRKDGFFTAEEAARAVGVVEAELNASAITALQMQIDGLAKKKNSQKEIAALEGQIAVQREKQLTREAALEQQINDIRRERAEANERLHRDAENTSQRELTGLEESNKRMREDLELIGLTEKSKQGVIDARMQHTIAVQRERVALLRNMSASEDDLRILELEENKLLELVEARNLYNDTTNKERYTKDVERVQGQFDQWRESFTGNLSSDIADSIISGGEGSGEKLRKTLQDALIRQPLTAVINASLNQLMGGVLQMMGLGGSGGVAGALGGGNGIMGLVSNLGSLYTGATKLWSGVSAMFTTQATTAGALNVAADTLLTSAPGILETAGGISAGSTAAGAGAAAGSWGAGGIAGLIAMAVINAVGAMRSESKIGSGLAGTLGNGSSLTPWEEWREGGSLLQGPDFTTGNPLEVLQEQRKRLQVERDAGRGETNYAVSLQATVTSLEKSTKGLETSTAVYNREIQKGYKAYRENVVDMANGLGLAGDSLADFAYTLGAQDLNLQGLKPEEIQAKIATMFGLAGDKMAEQMLGSWKEVTDTVVNTWSDTTDPHNVAYTTETTVNKRMEYEASAYAKVGETAIQTLTRLSTSFNTLNEASDALGFGIHKGSLSLANFADEFIEAFGGMERFATQTNSFLQNYYTGEERRAAGIDAAVRQAERIGLKGVTRDSLGQATRDTIKTGVNSLYSNPELYGDAMEWANGIAWLFETTEEQAPVVQELANTVDELTQMYENAIKSLKSEAQNLAVDELRARGMEKEADALKRQQYLDSFADSRGQKLDDARLQEIATLYDSNRATEARIKALKDAEEAEKKAAATMRAMVARRIDFATSATDAAYAEAQRWIDIQRGVAEEAKDAAQSVFELLKSNVQELYREVGSTSNALGMTGTDFISQALATAKATGYLPDSEKLGDAIGDVRNAMEKQTYGSRFESERARLILAGNLSQLEEMAGDQLSDAEQQLAYLDGLEKTGEEQLSQLRGIGARAVSMDAALAALVLAYNTEAGVRAANAGKLLGTGSAYYDTSKGTGTTQDGTPINGQALFLAAQTALGQGATAQTIWDAIAGSGFTMEQANQIMGMPAGTLQAEAQKAGLPVFHNGTAMVQNTGFALLERGEEVVTKGRNPAFAGAGAESADQAAMRLEAQEQNDTMRESRDLLRDIKNAFDGQGTLRVRLGQDQLSQLAAMMGA